jgi:hypothetical protein
MVDICSSLQAKIKAGDYDNLVPVVAEPWSALHVARKALAVDLDSLDSGDEPKVVQRKRLDLDALAKHYHEHEPTGTFAASVCNMSLEDGSVARLVYAFPKYCMQHAVERKSEMTGALLLGLASAEEQVQHALASPQTGANPEPWLVFCLLWILSGSA